jgi:ArsR family transcriptional regulator, arsenate/arsenite/antimonite-responsive transcriptional repressor
MAKCKSDLIELTAVTKALADGSRLRAIFALQGGELCVCQIIELLDLAPSTVSKHMFLLRNAGLVEARKDGRWIYFRLAEKPSPLVRGALAWLRGIEPAAPDARRLRQILKIPPAVLSRRFCCG